jgi:PAS domain S-box-containing protein
MDGYAVLARLREDSATRDIPVIFVTALDSAADEERGLELGAVDYIVKPYQPAIILARVRTQLELKRARDRLTDQNATLETEMAKREAILHTITTAARDAIVMIDDAGRIVFWNPAAESMFGYAAGEAQGREVHALLAAPHFQAAADSRLADFQRNGAGAAIGKTVEVEGVRKDGTTFPAEISLAGVRRAEGWWSVGVVRDITERKLLAEKFAQAQHQLLHSEKLAAVGQLAAGVAHEINNPIAFVSSNVDALKRYVADILAVLDAYAAAAGTTDAAALAAAQALRRERDLDYLRDDIDQLIAESQEGLQRVRSIVQDLKGFVHAETADWQWADLHGGLESTLNMVWNELKYHCTLHREYGELPQVRCLPSRLNQVFMNLLVNAGHAIVGKGDITIRTGRQGDEVFVAIADTGSGIAAENLPHLFDPFFTTKPVGKGTGLGLSLSRDIVEKHRGRIEVASEVGAGTTFTIRLPIDPETLMPAGAAADA